MENPDIAQDSEEDEPGLYLFDSSPCEINFTVLQKNRVPEVAELVTYTINATLAHRIYHLKELIWIYSDNHSLKPEFLTITYNGHDLNDTDTIGDIMNNEAYGSGTWTLTIDYTQFYSPFISQRDPEPTEFLVEVDGDFLGRNHHFVAGATLDTSVDEIKSFLISKFRIATPKFDLEYEENILDPAATLREAFHLDVPMLYTANLQIANDALTVFIQLNNVQDDTTFDFEVGRKTTFHDAKMAICEVEGTLYSTVSLNICNESLSKSLSTPDYGLVMPHLVSERDDYIWYKCAQVPQVTSGGKRCKRTGESMVELEKPDGIKQMVKSADVGSEYYTIDLLGSSVKFSTSDLIFNDEGGYVLVSPTGYAKMQRTWPYVGGRTNEGREGMGHYIEDLGDSPNIAGPSNAHADRRVNENRTVRANFGHNNVVPANVNASAGANANGRDNINVRDNARDNADGRENVRDDANAGDNANVGDNLNANVARDENPGNADDNQNAANLFNIAPMDVPVANALNPGANDIQNPGQTVLQRISQLMATNRQNIGQLVMRFVVILFVFGLDIFRAFLRTEILVFLVCTGTFLLFFFWGEDVSNWLDHYILTNAPLNQLDFLLVHRLSNVFRFCYTVNLRVHAIMLGTVVWVLPKLFCPRYEVLTRRLSGQYTRLDRLRDMCKEALGVVFLFVVTFLPSLLEGVDQYMLETRNAEPVRVRDGIRHILAEPSLASHRELLAKAAEVKFGCNINEFLSSQQSANFDMVLRCFVAVVQTKNELQREQNRGDSIFAELHENAAEHEGEHESEVVGGTPGHTGSQFTETDALVVQR